MNNNMKKKDYKKMAVRIACFAMAALMLLGSIFYTVYFLFA